MSYLAKDESLNFFFFLVNIFQSDEFESTAAFQRLIHRLSLKIEPISSNYIDIIFYVY